MLQVIFYRSLNLLIFLNKIIDLTKFSSVVEFCQVYSINLCTQIFSDNVSYCDFLEVTFESTFDIPPMPQGWIYPINSMLQPIFDQFMVEVLKTGVYDRIKTNLRPPNPTCQSNGMGPIDINFVAILFILLAIGVIIAILLFILEKFGINCDIFKTDGNEIPEIYCRCDLRHH